MAYSYTDKYGNTHVTKNEATAKQYASQGTSVSSYSGNYGGGYAKSDSGTSIKTKTALPTANTSTVKPATVSTPTQTGRVTDTYKDVQWDSKNRTITAGGKTLQTKEPWQVQLESYQNPANRQQAEAEIARAGQVYNQKISVGDIEGARKAHTWANQIRDAMGLKAGVDYDPVSGARLNTTANEPVMDEMVHEDIPWFMQDISEEPLYQQELPYQEDVQDLLGQLRDAVETPFSYNPATDPAYKSMVDAATQSVFESMNQRGILASTVTRDSVSQAIAPIIQQLTQFAYNRYQDNISNLSTLLGKTSTLENQEYNRRADAEKIQYERQREAYLDQLEERKFELEAKEAQVKNASEKVKLLGYADNESSVILGIPVGTPSFEAIKTAQELESKIQIAKMDNESAMQRAQLSAATSTANNIRSINAANWRAMLSAGGDEEIDPEEQMANFKNGFLEDINNGTFNRQENIDNILNQRKLNLITYDQAQELLQTIDKISPASNTQKLQGVNIGDWQMY